MRIDFQLIFWLLVIAFVVITTIKRIKKQKEQEENARRDGNKLKNARPGTSRETQKGNNWEEFLDNVLGGVETGAVPTENRRPQELSGPHSEKRDETEVEETGASLLNASTKDEHKTVSYNESGIHHLHSAIEGRNAKTEIEEHVLTSSFEQSKTELALPDFYGDSKTAYDKKKRTKHAILQKGLLKKAIVFSEIIGPPVSLRKKDHSKNRWYF